MHNPRRSVHPVLLGTSRLLLTFGRDIEAVRWAQNIAVSWQSNVPLPELASSPRGFHCSKCVASYCGSPLSKIPNQLVTIVALSWWATIVHSLVASTGWPTGKGALFSDHLGFLPVGGAIVCVMFRVRITTGNSNQTEGEQFAPVSSGSIQFALRALRGKNKQKRPPSGAELSHALRAPAS